MKCWDDKCMNDCESVRVCEQIREMGDVQNYGLHVDRHWSEGWCPVLWTTGR